MSAAVAAKARAALIPLFLISAGVVGYENALTRYFAVAKWSEYGYWVISIVMVGFALSGVVVAMFRRPIERYGVWIRALSPAAMVIAAAAGYHYVTLNPFNPLQLQNATTWLPQIGDIGLYYACLLPFFFLAGVYVSLSFVLNSGEIGRVYAYDLIGAGVGSALALALMFVLHPYMLIPVLLVPLALSVVFQPGRGAGVGLVAALAALIVGEGILFLDTPAPVNDFKAIYAPLHTPGAKVLDEVRSPRGNYVLADDFTERVDTDVSNNAGMMGFSGPPRTLGLYRDGARIAAIPGPGPLDVGYAHASLDAAPYLLKPSPRVLLVGVSGGYRIAESLVLGAAHIDALEPEPVLRSALIDGLDGSRKLAASARVRVLPGGPSETTRNAGPRAYDLIDISSDFLDAAEANEIAFTADAVADDLRSLTPDGIVSIPVSIKDLPVYAVRMLATARAGLLRAGIADPAAHVLVYRSAWSVRILISPTAWSAERIAALRKFCDDRSFDVSYYPGIDVQAARASLYNDLPSVSFTEGEVTSHGPDDAVADEAGAVLADRATPSEQAFNLTPITLDRPAFHAVLKLSRPDTLIKRLEILPQGEIGGLVNLAVLAQAIVFALLVLATPLVARRWARAAPHGGPRVGVLRPVIYFSALGLGFLFLEIFLIEQVSVYLNDRTSAFAIVLTGMLIFSGLGSLLADRLKAWPMASVAVASALVLAWCAAMFWRGETAMLTTLDQPWAVRAAIALAVTAPLSIALGLPFPLGLTRVGTGAMLPWVWGLNGAFSVVATPLANLVARQAGYSKLLIAAAVLYVIVVLALPPVLRTGRGGETTT
jgi:hypothetical protein